ncbi:hypothetical protein [Cryptosporangium arvum]|uniref:Uncharacterized protein n=1 Tax=Cryptosporangium arvum DSM 44712 TaxID=927661 RepID=A0A010YRT7_9ACTN|nr:hypothetical protein [Cryptosporangium arvum]EXG82930.1 hypothetical protein CryarDRAFT_4134 [Cryptosporangium arvum DSM 44712]
MNTNVAKDSLVGVQAQNIYAEDVEATVVHGDFNRYELGPDDPPEKEFGIGVAQLDDGTPHTALDTISRARARGLLNNSVRFHWLLAFFSGRTVHQLDEHEVRRLQLAQEWIQPEGDDEWAEGLRTIENLLNNPGDRACAAKEIETLPDVPRRKILRHLELLLEGASRDALWEATAAQARADQFANDRTERVWKFFEADPVRPRPAPMEPGPARIALVKAAAACALFTSGAGYLAWIALRTQPWSAILPILAVALGVFAYASGTADWRIHRTRPDVRAAQYRYRPRTEVELLPELTRVGFTRQIDRYFAQYFREHMPADADASHWSSRTAAVRRKMRNDIVRQYRESRVSAERLRWLVEFRAEDVARRYRDGTLPGYAKRFRAITALALLLLGGVLLAFGGGLLIWLAVSGEPLRGLVAVLCALGSGVLAARWGIRVAVDKRLVAAENAEAVAQFARDLVEYRRWNDVLRDRPTDPEMAAWLDCDRKLLITAALERYKLLPSQVIAHAVLEAKAESSRRRARMRRGTWRYERYSVRVFLLTHDGVRQVAAEIDLARATRRTRQRANYRFDAIASVQVTETDARGQIFELTLINGDPIKEEVVASEVPDEDHLDADIARELTLDSAGLNNTLHVLEGIAAEGKEWARQRSRGTYRNDALRSLFGSAEG